MKLVQVNGWTGDLPGGGEVGGLHGAEMEGDGIEISYGQQISIPCEVTRVHLAVLVLERSLTLPVAPRLVPVVLKKAQKG